VRARALRAPVLLSSLPRKTGRCAPTRPSQLRCFSFDPQKYIKSMELGPPTSKAFFFPLNHMQTEDPSDFNILGSKLCTGAALIFFGFSFFIWLLDLFFLLFSSFYFLLIHLFLSFFSYLFSTILRLLIRLFLYFKLFVVLQTGHSEGFFEAAKPLLIHLGSKLMYTVRSYVLTFWGNPFLLDFDLCFLLLSSYSSLRI
jgi:hypothetical protein